MLTWLLLFSALDTKSLLLRQFCIFMPNINTTFTPPRAEISFTTERLRRDRQKHLIQMLLDRTSCSRRANVLFTKVRTFSNHILHALLPPPSTASQNYSLRHRSHSFQLPVRSTHLSDCNFINRMLLQELLLV